MGRGDRRAAGTRGRGRRAAAPDGRGPRAAGRGPRVGGGAGRAVRVCGGGPRKEGGGRRTDIEPWSWLLENLFRYAFRRADACLNEIALRSRRAGSGATATARSGCRGRTRPPARACSPPFVTS